MASDHSGMFSPDCLSRYLDWQKGRSTFAINSETAKAGIIDGSSPHGPPNNGAEPLHADAIEMNHHSSNLKFRVSRQLTTRAQRFPRNASGNVLNNISSIETGSFNFHYSGRDKTSDIMDLAALKDKLGSILGFLNSFNPKPDIDSEMSGAYFSEGNNLATLLEMDSKTICRLSVSSKETSMAVQSFLGECDPISLNQIAVKLYPFIQKLICHRFGNFVVQRMISKHRPSLTIVENLGRRHFSYLITNENSSRVLELVIGLSKKFRDFALHYFQENLKEVLASYPASLLLVACIKKASDPSNCNFILRAFDFKANILGNKCFRRILLNFLNVASRECLDQASELLRINERIKKMITNKKEFSIVVALLRRHHSQTWQALFCHLKANPLDLIASDSFLKAMTLVASPTLTFSAQIVAAMVSFAHKRAAFLSQKVWTLGRLVYFTLLFCGEVERHLLLDYFDRYEIKSALAQLLNSSTGISRSF